MKPIRIFISSVQPEFAAERAALRDYLRGDTLMRRFFEMMLFSDRLEVWNHGTLPPSLTLEKLRSAHGSVPGNPLLAEPMYLTRYIERRGTGIGDMIRRCQEAGLHEPEFTVTDGFKTIIRRVKASEPREEPREEAREETAKKILALIKADPSITMQDLARAIAISPKGIEWQIRKLRQAGMLKHVGPTKGGRGEIIGGTDE